MSRPFSLARCQAGLLPSASPRAASTCPVVGSFAPLPHPRPSQRCTRSTCPAVASRQNVHIDSSSMALLRSRTCSLQPTRKSQLYLQWQTRQRLYHSASHPEPPPTSESYTAEQLAILSAALSHVPSHGFSTHALTLGARDSGYLEVSLQLFPRGGEAELVMYWLASRREELRRRVERGEIFRTEDEEKEGSTDGGSVDGQPTTLSVEEKVRTLIIERLKMNEDVIKHWQDALAIMSLPSNVPPSLCELYALSSDILYLAGDKSIDASWYAKRLSVATVYASAEVVMTEDTSEGFVSTTEFVDRRIKDADTVVGAAGDIKKSIGYLASSAAAAGRSFGMKI